ncbi:MULTISPECIES: SsgA family sporulation/cell division regulator [unclassified Nocardioides]|uniref:SsgA family sporulation/cell division regulator n=1 Tax=unclassified Nocardioides TaxID=2615069 RepID=UPI000A874CE6|nr:MULTISPECIES: SsgA family sporulation/cell division regulator [unclassified Nocardioides]
MHFDRSRSADTVTQEITMRCVDADGETVVLEATLGYDAADPYAVTATFRTEICEVVWTFARDLLTRGLTDPTGEGDVHVWPCLDANGRAVVIIELCSPDGELLVQAPTTEITKFVNRTLARVPVGTESTRIDVDELIDQLLAV